MAPVGRYLGDTVTDHSTNADSNPSPRSTHTGDAATPDLTIVIPALNEAGRIGRTIDRIGAWAESRSRSCELIIVDDGSTDGTRDVVAQTASGRISVRVLTHPRNLGKGAAVRTGVLAGNGATVLTCDADLAVPIEELAKLEPWLDRGFDVVIGSRDMPDSVLDPPQPLHRRLMALTFRAIRRRLMLSDIRDTQCGFKLFRGEVARSVFARQTMTGWTFDCEVLGIARILLASPRFDARVVVHMRQGLPERVGRHTNKYVCLTAQTADATSDATADSISSPARRPRPGSTEYTIGSTMC